MCEEVPPYHKHGQWVQCGIVGMSFPKEPMEFTFCGHTLYLLPGRPKGENDKFGDLYPVVAVEHSGMSFEDGQRLISTFINSVAWARKTGIRTAQFGGGSRIQGLGGHDAKALVDDHFELNYVPEPADEAARLALAFYREGLTLNSVAYQCLSFFKILNIALSNSNAQIEWIDANIAEAQKLDPHSTRDWEKKAGFDPNNQTAGNYLYVSNRCAVAHAFSDPLIDPDDPADLRRLANDLPMVKALAEHFIEQEFGVKSALTVWREHRYELAGFTELFGDELVARIKAGEEVPIGEFPGVQPLSVRLAFRDLFSSFEDMSVEVVDCADQKVNLALNSANGLASVMLVLDFGVERLDFDIFHHMATEDDGSAEGAKAELDKLRFIDSHLLNGKLEIWAGAQRLSRKDAFIPVNVDMGATHEIYEVMISTAEATLKQRNG
ncbi:hypothetical protein T8J41_15165 [Nitratireductor rhodophyticola]|uniref:methylamine utilization protein MauJ n=1 Tax=Nitratireductor rhodophyticola TaxID=2854036 RepID=UPI002AC9E698|nr:methylamine utilization protein MauJ [Nitratireductor rhodophyticola]WPZ13479.1 hypothetical protein T8J41_15165 [Nitratireductor rhodophyticola]